MEVGQVLKMRSSSGVEGSVKGGSGVRRGSDAGSRSGFAGGVVFKMEVVLEEEVMLKLAVWLEVRIVLEVWCWG